MHSIPVDGVVDGMVLARPVEDRLGRVLLMKGDVLQARYRDKLRSWGITEVVVEGEADPVRDLAQFLAPDRRSGQPEEAVANRVERRFQGFDERHPVMAGLKLLALKHLSAEPPKA